jgi:hypothetical protein
MQNKYIYIFNFNILYTIDVFTKNNCGSVRHCLFFNSHSGGWNPHWVHSARRPLLVYCTCPRWLWGWRIWWNKGWQGNRSTRRKPAPGSATLSITNPTSPDPGANPGKQRLTARPTATFLDDTEIVATHEEPGIVSKLQAIINKIDDWAKKWRTKVNQNKLRIF